MKFQLFLFSFLASMLLLASSVFALGQFNNRVAFNITNPNAYDDINFQVLLNITKQTDMTGNFSDLWFTNSTDYGMGVSWVVTYDDWVENYTSDYGMVWVKIDRIPASSTMTIYGYYNHSGMPLVGTMNNGTNTFEAFEDCQSPNGYTSVGGTIESTLGADGSVLYNGVYTCGYHGVNTPDLIYKNYTATEKRFVYDKVLYSGSYGGIVYDSVGFYDYCAGRVIPYASFLTFNGASDYSFWFDGTVCGGGSSYQLEDVTSSAWYQAKVYSNGTSDYNVWFGPDNGNWSSWDNSSIPVTQTTGAITNGSYGFLSSGSDYTHFAYVFITNTNYPDEDPSVSYGPMESPPITTTTTTTTTSIPTGYVVLGINFKFLVTFAMSILIVGVIFKDVFTGNLTHEEVIRRFIIVVILIALVTAMFNL
jgi:hypothetical protein